MQMGIAETNRRYAAARAELRARGVLRASGPDIWTHLLHWTGLEPRPVLYLSWQQSLLLYAMGFAITQILVDHLLSWTTGLTFGAHTVALVMGALLLGSLSTIMQLWRKRKLGLSDWEQF
ncbi:DUF6404 family protein [Thioclava sp.]|uniref:DUF6404 family protein n=1 Tax=Thioclava sp. TaxID=1933450 RepID=UPI003AA93CCE